MTVFLNTVNSILRAGGTSEPDIPSLTADPPPDLHWNIADTARTLEMSALVVGATDSAAPADSRYSPLIIQQISIS
ncbi:hypothetical protein BKH06_12165 [Actinomyces naeslundii]|nr:hypothetical protein BKH06_12165 [Actinomyces naeslundii]